MCAGSLFAVNGLRLQDAGPKLQACPGLGRRDVVARSPATKQTSPAAPAAGAFPDGFAGFAMMEVGSFCCSVLPIPPVSASVARCGPNRAFVLVTQSVRTLLRGNRERLVVVGTCGFERFYGAFRPGKNSAFQHTSILVRPRQLSRSAGTLHACPARNSAQLVEPPGTAPGSAASIARRSLSP